MARPEDRPLSERLATFARRGPPRAVQQQMAVVEAVQELETDVRQWRSAMEFYAGLKAPEDLAHDLDADGRPGLRARAALARPNLTGRFFRDPADKGRTT